MQNSNQSLINHIKHAVLLAGILAAHLTVPSSSNWRDYVPSMQLWLSYIPPLKHPNFLSFIHYALRVKSQEYTYRSHFGLQPSLFRFRKQVPPYSLYKK